MWMWTERNCYWVPSNVRTTNFCWSNWKVTRVWTTSRKDGCVVLRHGRTCSKMRWKILRTGEQKDRAVVQSLKPLLGWSPFQERGTWIRWSIVKSMLTNCLDVLVSISLQMDRSLWPTVRKIYFLCSSHEWLSCVKHDSALSIGSIPRLRFCWWSWGLKINFGGSLMCLWKSNICPHQLDV